MDGEEIFVHGNAQDQVGQIAKSGKLVIYGDVGQTFMYGAKGGDVFVMGNAAGRPLNQRRRAPARRDQRYVPGLLGGVLHGRRPYSMVAAS
jgi:glutamate synthase domain-containing protein 3